MAFHSAEKFCGGVMWTGDTGKIKSNIGEIIWTFQKEIPVLSAENFDKGDLKYNILAD